MSKGENKIKGQNRVVKLGLTFYFAFIEFTKSILNLNNVNSTKLSAVLGYINYP